MSDTLGREFKDYYYQTDKVILLPYKDHRDVFREDLLVHMYAQLLKDGTLDMVFAGMPNVTLNRFVSYLSKQPVVIYVIKPNNVVGFGWVTQAEGVDGARKGSFGFTFFRKYWGTEMVRDLCWLSLHWWFHVLKIDILYATSLRTNRLATNFSRNFGFSFIGVLPMFFEKQGRLVDGTLICLKKSDFDPHYEFWRQSQEIRKESGIESQPVLTS